MSDEFKDFHDVPLTREEKELVVNTVAEGVENQDTIIRKARDTRVSQRRLENQFSRSEIGSKGFSRAKEEFRDKCGDHDQLGKIRQCLAKDMGDEAATAITEVASTQIHEEIDQAAELEW